MIGAQGSDLRVPATAKLIALVLGMASVTSTSKFGAPIRRFSFWQSPRPCRTPALTRSSWNWTSLSMFRREERDLLRCSLLSFHALAPYFAWNVFDVATSCRSNSTCRRVSRNFHRQHKETRHAQPVSQVSSGTAATSRSLPPGPRAGRPPAAPSRRGGTLLVDFAQ